MSLQTALSDGGATGSLATVVLQTAVLLTVLPQTVGDTQHRIRLDGAAPHRLPTTALSKFVALQIVMLQTATLLSVLLHRMTSANAAADAMTSGSAAATEGIAP